MLHYCFLPPPLAAPPCAISSLASIIFSWPACMLGAGVQCSHALGAVPCTPSTGMFLPCFFHNIGRHTEVASHLNNLLSPGAPGIRSASCRRSTCPAFFPPCALCQTSTGCAFCALCMRGAHPTHTPHSSPTPCPRLHFPSLIDPSPSLCTNRAARHPHPSATHHSPPSVAFRASSRAS